MALKHLDYVKHEYLAVSLSIYHVQFDFRVKHELLKSSTWHKVQRNQNSIHTIEQ